MTDLKDWMNLLRAFGYRRGMCYKGVCVFHHQSYPMIWVNPSQPGYYIGDELGGTDIASLAEYLGSMITS